MPETPAARQGLTTLQKILGLVPGPATEREVFGEVCFICIDCEAFENDQSKVTEIGVSMLDTRDLKGIEYGPDGDNWVSKIHYAHFRIAENAGLVNRRFVKGREQYFNFGSTIWIKEEDARVLLHRLFASPGNFANIGNFSVNVEDQQRSIVLVGHGLNNDKAFLKGVGFSVEDVPTIVKHMDTAIMAGSTKAKTVALRRLLASLGTCAKNLHNGGNDAAYTIQALIRCAVKDYVNPGSVFTGLDSLPRAKIKAIDSGSKAANVAGGTATDNMIPSSLTRVRTVATTSEAPKDDPSTGLRRHWRQRRKRDKIVTKNHSREPGQTPSRPSD